MLQLKGGFGLGAIMLLVVWVLADNVLFLGLAAVVGGIWLGLWYADR